ncbi:protein kinase domain-containing protein [Planctomycetaceae bacterium SH139]
MVTRTDLDDQFDDDEAFRQSQRDAETELLSSSSPLTAASQKTGYVQKTGGNQESGGTQESGGSQLGGDTSEQRSSDTLAPNEDGSLLASAEISMLLDKLPRYVEMKVVGEGSFGTVFQARDQVLDRRIAIKVLKSDLPAACERYFLTEAQRLARLDHPGICKIFDFGVVNHRSFFVTEWLGGESLAKVAMPVPWRQACQWCLEITLAIAYAHRQDVVHRDLKPANVMRDEEGRIRLIDFGLAFAEDEEFDAQSSYGGSPAYMSPEQVSGNIHALDGRSDIWAIGVILYELLTAKRPFRGRRNIDVLSKIREKSVAPPRTYQPDIPVAVEQIVLACLTKQAERRIPTATELADRLRSVLAEHAAGAPAAGNLQTGALQTGALPAGVNPGGSETERLVSELQVAAEPRQPGVRTRPSSRGVATLALAAVACLALVAAGVWLSRDGQQAVGGDNQTGPDVFGESASPASQVASYLRVLGQRPSTGQAWVIDADEPLSPELRSGDRVTIAVQLEQRRHVYLVWLGTESGTTYLYPGPMGTRDQIGNPSVDRPIDFLELDVGTLNGTPSTETVLLVASREPFPDPSDFALLIASLPRPQIANALASRGMRGIHFDAHQWSNQATGGTQFNEALSETVAYLKREFTYDVIVQAVSFASGTP